MKPRLEEFVPDLRCHVSTELEKGVLWSESIRQQLEEADAGLLCLTPESVNSPWIHFEAGLLARAVGDDKYGHPRIYTYLHGLKPSDLAGPLASYQSTVSTRDDTERLVESISTLARTNGADSHQQRREGYGPWWDRFSADVAAIEPLPLEQVVPDFMDLFRRKTFDEPVAECNNQRWLDRYTSALECLRRLNEERPKVQAACRPSIVDLYDGLRQLVDGYAIDLSTYFLEEKRFDPNDSSGRLLIRPLGAEVVTEHRRTDIKHTVLQLVEPSYAPVMEEAPRFARLETFAERKAHIHRMERDINASCDRGGDPVISDEQIQSAEASDWEFDRIVRYLVIERRKNVAVDLAVRDVNRELEKVRASSFANPPHMALHYSLGPLKLAAGSERLTHLEIEQIKKILEAVASQARGRDKGGQMSQTLDEIRLLCQRSP